MQEGSDEAPRDDDATEEAQATAEQQTQAMEPLEELVDEAADAPVPEVPAADASAEPDGDEPSGAEAARLHEAAVARVRAATALREEAAALREEVERLQGEPAELQSELAQLREQVAAAQARLAPPAAFSVAEPGEPEDEFEDDDDLYETDAPDGATAGSDESSQRRKRRWFGRTE